MSLFSSERLQWFGRLSLCCAVFCYHYDDFVDFLDLHDYVTNKLACLARDSLRLEYIKPVAAVIASIGIHLVSYSLSCQNHLKRHHSFCYETIPHIHACMPTNDAVDNEFFQLQMSRLRDNSQNLFNSVCKEYTPGVVESVRTTAAVYI